jgi:2-polyprenyl-6-hydroxyphenyl methylase/3-demethylubiquinone-9 3-methyltransferase
MTDSALVVASGPALNADPEELRKFGDLAHRWWDKTGEFAPLHAINPLRLDWIAARATLPGARVVDIGCGGGILAESMAVRGADVTGIDLSEKPLSVAALHGLESGVKVRYERIATEALAAREPASYDVVTCMEMLEHVPDPAAVVKACATLVKPGGQVFFSTINRNLKAYLFAIIGAEYVLRLLPKRTHDYARFITPAELSRHARAAHLSPTDMTGLHYNPLTRRYWLAPNVDVNYMVATVRAE